MKLKITITCLSNNDALADFWVCCLLCTNTWHSPNAVSMLTHRLPRWPGIETALGDCIVFSDCCMPVTMLVTLTIPASETSHKTIYRPNTDGVMLGHCLQRWANIITIKTSGPPLNRNWVGRPTSFVS